MGDLKPIIFFDGVCNLCNSSVQYIIKRDKNKIFLFSSLQSNYAQSVLSESLLNNTDSIVLKDGENIFIQSDAIISISRLLGFPFNMLRVTSIVPKRFRDWVYSIIAHNRYKWFGKQDSCMIPTQELKERFID